MAIDIAVIKRKLLAKYPFFGSLVASLEFVESQEIPTTGTDGEKVYYNTNYGSVEGTSTNVGKYEADEDNWVVSTTSGNFITQTCTSNSTCNLWDYNANGWLFSKTGHLPVNGSEWISRRGNDYTNTLNQATDWSYNQMVGTAYRETDTAYEVWLYVQLYHIPLLE